MGSGSVRSNDLTPGYGWNEDAGQYIDLNTGRFVSHAQIRSALDATIRDAKDTIRDLARGLNEGDIRLSDWQTRMAQEVKMIHLASGADAVGGWAQLDQRDYGRIGYELRRQYAYLQNFALQIESGDQRLNGTLINRALMYGESGRRTYEQIRRADMALREMNQERRVLGVADHCDDCIAIAAEGWQPIGTLPPIGNSQCLTHCHCTFDYRQVLNADDVGGFGL